MQESWRNRLFPLIENPEGLRFSSSKKRFEVVVAGRRSGKSERAKRKFILRVLAGSKYPRPRYIAAAPTHGQAHKIYFNDFKDMIPPFLIDSINKSESSIMLKTGQEILVFGLDNPARVEGAPIDGMIIDETDDLKANTLEAHVYPCFTDRQAWCMFLGVPNGMGLLYNLSKNALIEPEDWDFYTWPSSEVLPKKDLDRFKKIYDARFFQQEFEASFLNFTGRVYYAFTRENYKHELWHNPSKPLIFCFDYNVSPGIAVVCQEQEMPGQFEQVLHNGVWLKQPVIGTGVIGEVWIPQNSNTLIVCQRLYNDWKHHKGEIICYGDAAGGNKTASAVSGSDWDLIKAFFKNTEFANRISYKYPRANPPIKKRINSMNSRFCSVTGIRRMMVDAVAAPKLIEDLEQLSLLEGGSGEIDEKKNKMIGHECFSGYTLVQTDCGIQRIDSIAESGKIKGYDGKMHRYINGGKPTGIKPTVKVLLSNGEEIICTPTHEFLTLYGWKKAIDIEGDYLYNELLHNNERQLLCKKTLSLMEFLFGGMASITGAIQKAEKLDFTSIFGKSIMEKFRKAFVFITSTKTDKTTLLKTCRCCLAANIQHCTCNHQSERQRLLIGSKAMKQSQPQTHGTLAKRVKNGILSLGKYLGKKGARILEHAKFAAKSIKQNAQGILCSFAPKDAKPKVGAEAELIILPKLARLAAKNFQQINMLQTNIAPKNAALLEEKALIQRSYISRLRVLIAKFCLKRLRTSHKNSANEHALLRVISVTPHKTMQTFCPTVESGCFLLANGCLVSNSAALGYYVTEEFPVDSSNSVDVYDL